MEEVEIGETPCDNIKEIELILGNIKYKCEIQKTEKNGHGDYLDISVYNNKIKYKGLIHIYKFNLIKDDNKYKLQIKFIILTQKRYINIDLNDNINNNDKYIKEIIKAIENKIIYI